MCLQQFQRYDIDSASVGRIQHDLGRGEFLRSLQKTRGTQTPAIAGLQPREAMLGTRCRQIVAKIFRQRQKFRCHHNANGVIAAVFGPGVAATIPIEPSQRIDGAGLQRLTQNIERWFFHTLTLA